MNLKVGTIARFRQRDAREKRAKRLPGTLLQPADVPLLRQIAQSPDGWHHRALDPFKRAHLIEAGMLRQKGERLRLTDLGKAELDKSERSPHERDIGISAGAGTAD